MIDDAATISSLVQQGWQILRMFSKHCRAVSKSAR
jgi:hypothetical protein